MRGRKDLKRTATEVTSRSKRRLSSLLMLFLFVSVTVLLSLRVFLAVGGDRSENSRFESVPGSTHRFEPTKVNEVEAQPAPGGMVWIPGGEFSMGASDPRVIPDTKIRAAGP